MRIEIVLVVFLVLVDSAQAWQPAAAESPTTVPDQLEAEEPNWDFSLSAYTYIIEDDEDYVQTTFTADFNWLHLEARHQYEDLDTASIWLGYNLSFGGDDDDDLTLDFTPMIGGVFGDTDGFAPGYEITLAWRQFELYTEGEFVFDTNDSDDNFFYSWTELTWSPSQLEWMRVGLAVQRTKIREEDTDFELGPMVGITLWSLDFSAFLLYPEEGDPSVVLGLSFEF